VLIKKENDDNIEASLKEGEDVRVSEHRHIRDHFQITFMREKWQLKGIWMAITL